MLKLLQTSFLQLAHASVESFKHRPPDLGEFRGVGGGDLGGRDAHADTPGASHTATRAAQFTDFYHPKQLPPRMDRRLIRID